MKITDVLAANLTESPWLTVGTSAMSGIMGIIGAIIGAFFGAQRNEKAQNHRDQAEMRRKLLTSMTSSAGALYMQLQHYWRAQSQHKEGAQQIIDARKALDDQYVKTRAAGDDLEQQLTAYFASDTPRLFWHRTMDLLSIRYFQLLGTATDALLQANAGPQHTGLPAKDLKNPGLVLTSYRESLRAAIRGVIDEPLASALVSRQRL